MDPAITRRLGVHPHDGRRPHPDTIRRRLTCLDGLETRIHGDLDLHGFLGLNSNVLPGYEQIQVTIKAIDDFDDNQLAELASHRYSPARDIVSNPVPIAIDRTRTSSDPCLARGTRGRGLTAR